MTIRPRPLEKLVAAGVTPSSDIAVVGIDEIALRVARRLLRAQDELIDALSDSVTAKEESE